MRLLSYNIQVAINSSSYTSYTYQWHRQILPDPAKTRTLSNIANFINAFDIVCLQEVELGGLRNNFNSQAEQLLRQTQFTHHLTQVNRRVSKLSVHGNMILSKYPLTSVVNLPLPSKIRGRGMLSAQVQCKHGTIVIANVHLSLGKVDQHRQLRFIRTRLKPYAKVVLMGDFNCTPTAPQLNILTNHGYQLTGDGSATFPTWKPKKCLDHVLIKGDLAAQTSVSDFSDSDHFPVITQL